MKKSKKLRPIECFAVTVYNTEHHTHVDYYVDCSQFRAWCSVLPKCCYFVVFDIVRMNKPYLTFSSDRCIDLDNDPLINIEKV